MPSDIVKNCSAVIAAAGWNIFFAESATAGRMSAEFALTEGSGKILRGGIACYEVFIKENILKVPHKLIEDHTPESAEVTAALARQSAIALPKLETGTCILLRISPLQISSLMILMLRL